MPKLLILTLLTLTFAGCIGAGTLGGFEDRVFPVPRARLARAIDSLYAEYPEYKLPEKWQPLDDWKERGYGFLDSRIFYFKNMPEEMYYISFIGMPEDSTINNIEATISVRAVRDSASGWMLEAGTSRAEKRRIEKRFDDEIIAKLERYTGVKAIHGN